MIGRPTETEASPFVLNYINQITGDDPIRIAEEQLNEALTFFQTISEEASLRRYAPEKWSIRQVVSHLTDTERAFGFRILWFGRGFDGALTGFDQETAVKGAEADSIAWVEHVEEFRQVRLSTITLLRHMTSEGWKRGGIANGKFITVRAASFLISGHVAHHLTILREKYLK